MQVLLHVQNILLEMNRYVSLSPCEAFSKPREGRLHTKSPMMLNFTLRNTFVKSPKPSDSVIISPNHYHLTLMMLPCTSSTYGHSQMRSELV